MSLEFDILKKPLETELRHEYRTKPSLIFLAIGLAIILIIPFVPSFESYFFRIMIILFPIIFLFIFSSTYKLESKIIKENLIGKLIVNKDPFEIRVDSDEVLIDKEYKGKVILKYEGYFKEVVGRSKNPNIYYGTKNSIILKDSSSKKKFFIYLDEANGKTKFESLAEILFSNGIDVVEFTRGEKTYLGKKLNYKEIQAFKKKKSSNK